MLETSLRKHHVLLHLCFKDKCDELGAELYHGQGAIPFVRWKKFGVIKVNSVTISGLPDMVTIECRACTEKRYYHHKR